MNPARAASPLAGALAVTALAVAPLAWQLPLAFFALAAGGLGLRALQLHRGWRPLPGALLGLAAVVVFGAVLWRFGSPVGREAGVSMLLGLAGTKALECRTGRDARVLVVLALFLLAANFFFEQSIGFAGYALLVVTAALATLAAIEVPASGWRRLLKLAAVKVGVALPLMVALFYLFPRLESPLGVLRDPGRTATTGLADSMAPGSFAQLIESREIAFRVRFAGTPPPADRWYWRGPVFWDYDGRRWRTRFPPAHPERLVPAGAPVDYTLIRPGQTQTWVLALERIDTAPPGTVLGPDRQLLLPDPTPEARQYTLRAWPDAMQGLRLDAAQRQRTLALPHDAAPRTRALAARWRAADATPDALVQRALAWFREQPFRYTLRPPPLTGDPVDAFLFDTRAGFCEYYAGAFVALMRAAGVPARVVAGYQGGEFSPVADYVLVRQSDAHAWAEVWLAGRGWVRVDPTAAVAPERVERGLPATLSDDAGLPAFLQRSARASWGFRLQALWDAVDYQWTAWVLGFSATRQDELLRALGLDRFGGYGLVLGLAASFATLALAYVGASWLRRARPRPAEEDATRAKLLAALNRHGLVPRPGEGPGDFARRAATALPQHADALLACQRRYAALRYGRAATPETQTEYAAAVRTLCRDLARH